MFRHCVGAAALILAAATAATAAETITSPTKGRDCKDLRAEQEAYVGRCAGPNGYGVLIEDMDGHLSVTFGPLGHEKSLAGGDDLMWREAEAGSAVGLSGIVQWPALCSAFRYVAANGRPRQAY